MAQAQAGAEQPLPHSMATRLAGWSARAHQYPVFSTTWFIYRMRSFRTPLLMLALVLLVLAIMVPAPKPGPTLLRFYLTFPAMWLVVAVALGLGRALAVLVRRRRWRPRREVAGIVCALLFGLLAALSLTPLVRTGAEPVHGRVPTTLEIEEARQTQLINLVVWLPVLAWLVGPFDLLAYFRQRGLLREAALQAQAEHYKNQRNEVEAQLSVLASQVEPHFLFNTLSGVRAAMLSDPDRGVVMIDHLIDYAFDHSAAACRPGQQVRHAWFAIRFGAGLSWRHPYAHAASARERRMCTAIAQRRRSSPDADFTRRKRCQARH